MHFHQLSTRVGVWVDGVVILKVGEYNAKNIAHLLSIGRHQLLEEERHSVHLPQILSNYAAHRIFEWVDQALPSTADDWTIPTMPTLSHISCHARPEVRLRIMIDFYMTLRYIGTRTDVQFEVASQIIDRFRQDWRSMDGFALEELRNAIRSAHKLFHKEGWTLLRDPVVRMVAHTFAYGIQHGMFADLHLVERVLTGRSALKDFIERVGVVRCPIGSLVATPAIYPLPVSRRALREVGGSELFRHGGLGLLSPAPLEGPSLGSDVFPFGEYPAASPPLWSISSTISVEDFRDLGLDGLVMFAGVQKREGGRSGGELIDKAGMSIDEDVEVDVGGVT
jgi:hypothetical protein